MATSVGQVFKNNESVGTITRIDADIAQLATSVITIGGLQYTTDIIKSVDMTISGIGGLDTGAVAAFKTYNIFAVIDSGDVALIASLNVIPSGYTTYNKIGKLNTTTAGAINGASDQDVGVVGDSKYSMLLEEAFIAQNGGGWILADGRDVSGSSYETLTGNPNVPDARGQFLRGKNNTRADGQENPDGDVALGLQQTDAMQGHSHGIGNKGSSTGGTSGYRNSGTPFTQPNQFTSSVYGDAGDGTPRTGLETAPKNVTMNCFIKIN